ncbi:MAG: glycosyltransferase family A protein [Idiomarina sp.]
MNNVLLVVPVYNDWDRLESLLVSYYEALEKHEERTSLNRNKYEICVVDNGSTRTTDLVERFSEVKWLQESIPGSYSARNKAISSQVADYYYFTDSDCIIDIDLLTILDQILASNKESKIIGGRVKLYPKEIGNETLFEAYDLITGLDQERYISKGTAITANLLVPRDVIKKIGAFDTSRFSGGDADFAQRAVRSGIALEFSSQLIVYHPARSDFIDFSEKVKRITGAQCQRLGALKSWILIPFVFLLLARDWRKILTSTYSFSIKIKALLVSLVIFFTRQKYALYFLFGGKKFQR